MKEKRVALITGASSGIGKEIAIQLARSGIHICINFSRSELKALEVQRQIDKLGGLLTMNMTSFISRSVSKSQVLIAA